MLMQEKFLTTSAVGAVVVGFALQDTLGNAFSGLAIQIEKPFHVGHWIRIGEHEGRVEEITWRATKLRTKATNFVIVPNSTIAKEAIINYSEPVIPTRLDVDVGATYEVAPDRRQGCALRGPRQRRDGAPDATAERAADRFRRVGDHLPRALLDPGFRSRPGRLRSGAHQHLLQLQATRHRDPVADPGRIPARVGAGASAGPDGRVRGACWGAAHSSRRSTRASASRAPTWARSGSTPRGETIMREGAPGGSMFVIVSGAGRRHDRRRRGPDARTGRLLRRDVAADRRAEDGHGRGVAAVPSDGDDGRGVPRLRHGQAQRVRGDGARRARSARGAAGDAREVRRRTTGRAKPTPASSPACGDSCACPARTHPTNAPRRRARGAGREDRRA